jgi:hypothetical protein
MLMVRKRSLRIAGMQCGNDYLIIAYDYLILDLVLLNSESCLPFRGNEPLIPLIPYSVTLTLAYPWVEG